VRERFPHAAGRSGGFEAGVGNDLDRPVFSTSSWPMRILVTGAAGNLGSATARNLLELGHPLHLMIHRTPAPAALQTSGARIFAADLADPASLSKACRGIECIIHFAGRLFAPFPEKFLPITNVNYVDNLLQAARLAGVRKFILISFAHVEGESTPERPAAGVAVGQPASVHARTRLLAEQHLLRSADEYGLTAVILRPGMIYGRGILMIEAARWLMRRHLLGVWRRPTWIHLLAMPDFLACVSAAVQNDEAAGIYGLGDDAPLTLQSFLDRLAGHWGYRPPWRAPRPLFDLAGGLVEVFAAILRTPAPLTRDFIRIGMASYCSDTGRMKQELLPELSYPSLDQGIALL
jgi:nucleoside-diphosphate-sugar epimerase